MDTNHDADRLPTAYVVFVEEPRYRGEVVIALTQEEACNSESEDGWICNRLPRHPGLHVACFFGEHTGAPTRVVASWECGATTVDFLDEIFSPTKEGRS